MEYIEYTAIVTLLALMQFMLFSIQVGAMRVKHGVNAPAIIGHPEFERMFRIQQNTMEQMVVFVPALWIYAYLVNPLWGAGIGIFFFIGRIVYRAAYLKDPASRSNGFTIGVLATAVLLVWSLVAAVMSLI
jgi:glutathione S-transferase